MGSGLATREEVAEVETNFRNEIKHIDLDSELIKKVIKQTEEDLEDSVVDRQLENNEKSRSEKQARAQAREIKKKILKAEMMQNICNFNISNNQATIADL